MRCCRAGDHLHTGGVYLGRDGGKEIPSQSLAKEVGTVPEPLRQNSPGQLSQVYVKEGGLRKE
jgi:hypothetical protein